MVAAEPALMSATAMASLQEVRETEGFAADPPDRQKRLISRERGRPATCLLIGPRSPPFDLSLILPEAGDRRSAPAEAARYTSAQGPEPAGTGSFFVQERLEKLPHAVLQQSHH